MVILGMLLEVLLNGLLEIGEIDGAFCCDDLEMQQCCLPRFAQAVLTSTNLI